MLDMGLIICLHEAGGPIKHCSLLSNRFPSLCLAETYRRLTLDFQASRPPSKLTQIERR